MVCTPDGSGCQSIDGSGCQSIIGQIIQCVHQTVLTSLAASHALRGVAFGPWLSRHQTVLSSLATRHALRGPFNAWLVAIPLRTVAVGLL